MFKKFVTSTNENFDETDLSQKFQNLNNNKNKEIIVNNNSIVFNIEEEKKKNSSFILSNIYSLFLGQSEKKEEEPIINWTYEEVQIKIDDTTGDVETIKLK